MRKLTLLLICLELFSGTAFSQAKNLPVRKWNADAAAPLVIYISGDGGLNKFTLALCNSVSHSGYDITAINARSYFWDKKTPAITARAIEEYVTGELAGRRNQQWILAGFSFGADVAPFIVNNLGAAIRKKLTKVMMISPSTSTDFEIHLSDLFGGGGTRSMSVVPAVNTMEVPELITILPGDDKEFPVATITQKNHLRLIIPGDHHFDGKTDELAKTIAKAFQ